MGTNWLRWSVLKMPGLLCLASASSSVATQNAASIVIDTRHDNDRPPTEWSDSHVSSLTDVCQTERGGRSEAGHEHLLRCRRPVAERRVRPHGIVVLSPAYGDDPGFAKRVEDLAVQQLIAEPGVERLDEPVLPRTAWRNFVTISSGSSRLLGI